jgi:hypothetical protein
MLNLRFVSIRSLIFLVKDVSKSHFKSEYFTQYVKPDVRPIKVYFKGHDVTRFLTCKSHLTQFSYVFLANIAYQEGFKMSEVRTFFKLNNNTAAVKSRTVIKQKKGVIAFKAGHTSPVEAENIDNGSSPEPPAKKARVEKSYVAVPPPPEYHANRQMAVFSKYQCFDSALKLVLSNICSPIRFPQSKVEMYHNLRQADLGQDCLSVFKKYLQANFPTLTSPSGLLKVLNEFICSNGIIDRHDPSKRNYLPWTVSMIQMDKAFGLVVF